MFTIVGTPKLVKPSHAPATFTFKPHVVANSPTLANRLPIPDISPKIDNFQYFLATQPLTKHQFNISQNALKLAFCNVDFQKFSWRSHPWSGLGEGAGTGRERGRREGKKEGKEKYRETGRKGMRIGMGMPTQ